MDVNCNFAGVKWRTNKVVTVALREKRILFLRCPHFLSL